MGIFSLQLYCKYSQPQREAQRMSSVPTKSDKETAWFDEINHQLNALRLDCLGCSAEDQSLPTEAHFNLAMEFVQEMRTLAHFPKLPHAHVWVATDGHIGITWKTERRSLDILIAESVVAYTTTNKIRRSVELSNIHLAMQALAP